MEKLSSDFRVFRPKNKISIIKKSPIGVGEYSSKKKSSLNLDLV